MRFIHDDSEFEDLIQIVARDRHLSAGLIEKDYWVTHSLWALSKTRMEFWFKGGTSLSKGFDLIQRFSEDLDLRIEHGSENHLPAVKGWKSVNKAPIAERRAFYEALETFIAVPGAKVQMQREGMDKNAQETKYQVQYPGKFLKELPEIMRPFVLLEVGTARVTPFVSRSMSSFIHDWLNEHQRLSEFEDTRPHDIRCVHPMVTLLEKIDAIIRRFPRGGEAETFIRHYEDAARIVQAEKSLPKLEMGLSELIGDMIAQKQIRGIPVPDDPAFNVAKGSRRTELEKAHQAIAPMFWGDRLSFDEACEIIRGWLMVTKW